jgi:hypothetical protein
MRKLLCVMLCAVAIHAAPVPKVKVDSLAPLKKAIEKELDALDKPQAKSMATIRYASALHDAGDTKGAKDWLGQVKLPQFNPERQYEHSMYVLVAMKLGEAEKAESVYSAAVGQTKDMMQRVFRLGYVEALLQAGNVKRAGELLAAERTDMLGMRFHLLHAIATLSQTKDVDAGAKAIAAKGLAGDAAQFWCGAVDLHVANKDATKATDCRNKAFELMTQRGRQRAATIAYFDLKAICDLVQHADHREPVLNYVSTLNIPWMTKAAKSMELVEALAHHSLWAELPKFAGDFEQTEDRERYAPLLFDAYLHLNQPDKADELLKAQQAPLKTKLAYQRCLHYARAGKLDVARKALTVADELGGNAKTLTELAKKAGHDYPTALRERQTAHVLIDGASSAVSDLDELTPGARLDLLTTVLGDVSRARAGQNR